MGIFMTRLGFILDTKCSDDSLCSHAISESKRQSSRRRLCGHQLAHTRHIVLHDTEEKLYMSVHDGV